MDEKIVDEILDELFSSFEKSETDTAAILLLLKERGIASEEKLAPFIEQASRMSEVRWRAARVRMSALLKSAMKAPEQPAEKKSAANQDPAKKLAEAKDEKKEPAEMNERDEKKEPEKNLKPKADAEPKAESQTTAKPQSEDSRTPPESKNPAAGETESSQNNSRNNAEDPEKNTSAVPQKSTKPELEEKAKKNKFGDG